MAQLVVLWSVPDRALVCPTENSLSTLRAARGVFAAMDRPLSVSRLSARLCNKLPKAAPIRDRATTMETSFWYVQMNRTNYTLILRTLKAENNDSRLCLGHG